MSDGDGFNSGPWWEDLVGLAILATALLGPGLLVWLGKKCGL